MIDPKSEQYEIWYQSNLLSVRACEAWRKEIADLEAAREQVATSAYADLLADVSKAKLKDHLMLGGSDSKQMARTGNKQQMIAFLLEQKREEISKRIAVTRQRIKENQPSPLWQPRQEDAHA